MYDELFHHGVNIIHGSNGSGKSSLADFIFFGLGGDLKEWKPVAGRAEAVVLQIATPAGILTTRRHVSESAGRPMDIYFGAMEDALSAPEDRWQQLAYRRPDHGYSFSQVLFRAIGLPDAVSDGSSNITMHQLLRLLYVDQMTPVQRIFRVENFDTWQTKQAVGELLAGIGGYELYDRQIELRETTKDYDAAVTRFRSLVSVAAGYGENILSEHITQAIANLSSERTRLLADIGRLVEDAEAQPGEDVKSIRREAVREFNLARREVNRWETKLETLGFEIEDADSFLLHVQQSLREFDDAAGTFFALGHLEFAFCPSCFTPVAPRESERCHLCDAPHQDGAEDSRVLAVKLDLQMQLRESIALQGARKQEKATAISSLRVARVQLRRAAATIELARSGGATHREAAVSELSRKVGFIDSELESLQRRLEIAKQIQDASDAKEDLNTKITRLKDQIAAISRQQGARKQIAYSAISTQTKSLLDEDLEEHSDFGEVSHVTFEFSGDWIAINNEKNRAGSASGMVILKNSFAAGMLFASLNDNKFTLPRWMLFDNIEDKGMVEERSWNFQRILVKRSAAAKTDHQIIFTTSRIAPEFEGSALVVGRKYTRAAPSLAI
ncbi:AAA family ATPase [Mesorhizobium sp. M0870]|uniref:ATP-binding protein n=1 Tax=Mesorhizobium sp. M0870 TaxID=2957016 RepID=UPI003338B340